jgi:ribonuclease HI
MDSPTALWLELSHHAAFRIGGWAYVRRDPDGALAGHAGGERRTTSERSALTALIAALKDARRPVLVRTGSPLIVAIPARIAAAQIGEDAPSDDLDLWAQVMTALATTPVDIVKATPGDRTSGFAAAWAELGRDRAKDKGPFTSAIPRPNLTKSGAS